MPYTQMTLAEAAEFLHLDPAAVRALATHGEIPCERQGERLMFRRGELNVWSSQRILGLRGKHLQAYHGEGILHEYDLSANNRIVTELISHGALEPALSGRSRSSIIRAMVTVAERTGFLYDPADLLREIEEREELCSTGIEGGVALLHPRYHDPYMAEDSFIAIGRSVTPIPFGAPDGKFTDIFFLICCQDDRTHLHVLSRVCLLCHATQLADNLRQAECPEDMLECVAKYEKELLATC